MLAVVTNSAIVAAAAMQALLHVSLGPGVDARAASIIKVNASSGSVCHQQGECCIIYRLCDALCDAQLVKASCLSTAFVSVQEAKLAYLANCLCCHLSLAFPAQKKGNDFPVAPLHLYPATKYGASSIAFAAFSPFHLSRQQHLLALCISLARKFMVSINGPQHAKMRAHLVASLSSRYFARLCGTYAANTQKRNQAENRTIEHDSKRCKK
jgi:hypothetical protein